MAQPLDKMQKSIEALVAQNEKLAKSVTELKAEVAKKPVVVASKPAAMNSPKVETLSKSDEQPEMLSKSEVLAHLSGKKGSGFIQLIHSANQADSVDRLRKVYQEADRLGVKLPYKAK